MPGVARTGDKGTTGHSCSRIAPVSSRCYTVFANGKRITRKSDPVGKHKFLVIVDGKAYCLRHLAKVKQGSPTVFAQRKPIACLGHKMDKRGKIFQSSRDVFANGEGGIPDRGRGRLGKLKEARQRIMEYRAIKRELNLQSMRGGVGRDD